MHWLREIRDEYGWTQEELAEKLELSASFVSDIEQGKRRLSPKHILALVEVTRIGVAELQFRFALREGEFTLTMPKGEKGREVVRRLLVKWETFTEREFAEILLERGQGEG